MHVKYIGAAVKYIPKIFLYSEGVFEKILLISV